MWICELSYTIWRRRFLLLTVCACYSWQMALNIGLDVSFGKMCDWKILEEVVEVHEIVYSKWWGFLWIRNGCHELVQKRVTRLWLSVCIICTASVFPEHSISKDSRRSQQPTFARYSLVWKWHHCVEADARFFFLFAKECVECPEKHALQGRLLNAIETDYCYCNALSVALVYHIASPEVLQSSAGFEHTPLIVL